MFFSSYAYSENLICNVEYVGACYRLGDSYTCENQTKSYENFMDWYFELNEDDNIFLIKKNENKKLVKKSNIINIKDELIFGRKVYTTDRSEIFLYQYKTFNNKEKNEFLFIFDEYHFKAVNIFGKCK